jgi:hypothetical protein
MTPSGCLHCLEFGNVVRDGEEGLGKAGLVYRNEGFIAHRDGWGLLRYNLVEIQGNKERKQKRFKRGRELEL